MPPKATKAQKLSADTTTVVPASSSSTAAEADAVIAAAATAGADADANATAGAAEGPDAAAAVKEHPTMTLWKALKDPRNSSAKRSCGNATLAMAVLPVSAFFAARKFLFPSALQGGDWDVDESLTYSGIIAIITVNLIMVAFAVWAVLWDPDRDAYDPDLLVSPQEARRRLEEQRAEQVAEQAARRKAGIRGGKMTFAPETSGVQGMLMRMAALMARGSGGADGAGVAGTAEGGKKKKGAGKKAKAKAAAAAAAAEAGAEAEAEAKAGEEQHEVDKEQEQEQEQEDGVRDRKKAASKGSNKSKMNSQAAEAEAEASD